MEKTTPRLLAKAAGQNRYHGQPCKHGHGTERYITSHSCVVCHRNYKRPIGTPKYGKPGRPRKHERFIGPPKPKKWKQVHDRTTTFGDWVWRSKNGNQKHARSALTVEDYKNAYTEKCPLLGIELTYEKFTGNVPPNNYATLDRIDSSKGYTADNVHIVCYRANTLKNSATIEEMETILKNWKAMLQRNKN